MDLLTLPASFAKSLKADCPLYFESWGWEGDTAVLPAKWANVWESLGVDEYDHGAVLERCVAHPSFDPGHVFFVTSRGDTAGVALVDLSNALPRVHICVKGRYEADGVAPYLVRQRSACTRPCSCTCRYLWRVMQRLCRNQVIRLKLNWLRVSR